MDLDPSNGPERAEWEEKVGRPLRLADIWCILAHGSYTAKPKYYSVPKGVVILEVSSIGLICTLAIRQFLREWLRPEKREALVNLLMYGIGATEKTADILRYLHLYKHGDQIALRRFSYSMGTHMTQRRRSSSRSERKRYGLGLLNFPRQVPEAKALRNSVYNNGHIAVKDNPASIKRLDSHLYNRNGVSGEVLLSGLLSGDPSLTRVYEAGKGEERLAVVVIASCAVVDPRMQKRNRLAIQMIQHHADLEWARWNPVSPLGPGLGAVAAPIAIKNAARIADAANAIIPEPFKAQLKELEKMNAVSGPVQPEAKFHLSALGSHGPAPNSIFRLPKKEEGFANLNSSENEDESGPSKPRIKVVKNIVYSEGVPGSLPYFVFVRQGNGSYKQAFVDTKSTTGRNIKRPFFHIYELIALNAKHPANVFLMMSNAPGSSGGNQAAGFIHFVVVSESRDGEFPYPIFIRSEGPQIKPLFSAVLSVATNQYIVSQFHPMSNIDNALRAKPAPELFALSEENEYYRMIPYVPREEHIPLSVFIRMPDGQLVQRRKIDRVSEPRVLQIRPYMTEEELYDYESRFPGNVFLRNDTTGELQQFVLPSAEAAEAGAAAPGGANEEDDDAPRGRIPVDK